MSTSLLHLEAYQYTSLPPASSAFRLLKLRKGQGPELECELLQQSLLKDGHASYEALSYVWGSSELVECIMLDGKRLWVTDNLHSALQCLRLRDGDRFLWIDAICINQADKEEQSQQVRQMGTIYKLAEGVLFWLGKATSEIITLMEALRRLRGDGAELNLEQSMSDNERLDDCRMGLQQLLGRPWFKRVWILQEVANAQKGTVCCGTWTVPANIFAQAPTLLGVEPAPHCRAILDILPETSRSGTWWRQERDLYALLCRFQASKATDERDKIYALLGLSSNPLDIENIDVDYRQSIQEVIQKAISYLMQSTPTSMTNVLNIMDTFTTLDTTFFVPTFSKERKLEILLPNLQLGGELNETQSAENTTQGISIVHDPSLLSLEARPESSLKDQETCYSEVLRLLLSAWTSKDQEYQEYDGFQLPSLIQEYDAALQVIPWGSVEQHVKLLVIRDRGKAIIKAAMHSCGRIVQKLLHMGTGDGSVQWLQWSALQEAIRTGYKEAIHCILQQSPWLLKRDGLYSDLLQEAASQLHYNSCEVLALLLDWGGKEAQIMQEVAIAAAENYYYGYELMTMLLDHQNYEFHITKDLLFAVAKTPCMDKDHDIMALLLDQRGHEVQITEKIIVSAAKNRVETLKVLLDRFGNEIEVTQDILVAAAENLHNPREAVKLLLNQHADKTQITQEVLVAAAANHYAGEKVVEMLLRQLGDKGQITQEVVVAAAGNINVGSKVIQFLLNHHEDKIQVTQEVLIAAAGNYHSGEEVMELLLSEHIEKAQITEEVLVVAAENSKLMELLLFQYADKIHITQEVVIAAAGRDSAVLKLLLDQCGEKVQVTQEVVVAAAGHNQRALGLLLDRCGDQVQITQEAVVAAAGNYDNVLELLFNRREDEVQITPEVVAASANCLNHKTMELLLDRRRHEVEITQDTVIAAARNKLGGAAIIELLLQQCRDEIQVTQEVVIAAAGNRNTGVLALILNRCGDEVQITQEVVIAAAENTSKNALALLLNWRGDEVQITHEVVIAAAENENRDVLALLLNRRREEVQITQEVIVAAAGGHSDVLELLLDRRRDEVKITQEVVIAAAGSDNGRNAIQCLHRFTSIDVNDAVIQSAATAGQEQTLRLFDRWAEASIVEESWFDIARLHAAAKAGKARTVLKLTQRGVPPDTQDMRGITPLWRAAAEGHANVVSVLLETNAVDVNIRSLTKRTPLFLAAATGHAEVVELLLHYGAQQNYKDKDGRSPLMIARIMGQTQIVNILQSVNR